MTPPPPEPLRQGRMDPCFHALYTKFWPYHLNVAAETKTHQIRPRFSNLLLSNFGEPVQIVRFLFLADRSGTRYGLCCFSPSASGFDVLCIQRWYSALLGYNVVILVNVAFLSSLTSLRILLWPLTFEGIFVHTIATHWIISFFGPFSVNPRDGCVWKSQ